MMQPIVVGTPFEKIGIDIFGPFPISDTAQRNVIVAIDYFTQLVETIVVSAATSEAVAEFLMHQVVLRPGAPYELSSDQGKCFMAGVVAKLMRLL